MWFSGTQSPDMLNIHPSGTARNVFTVVLAHLHLRYHTATMPTRINTLLLLLQFPWEKMKEGKPLSVVVVVVLTSWRTLWDDH